MCWRWIGLSEDTLSARDRFSGISRGWTSLFACYFYILSFSPTLGCVEGMNRLTRGLLAISFLVPSFSEGQGQSWVDRTSCLVLCSP